jgi:transposase-like protein
MTPIFYARHRFPPNVIRHAVWLYLRFTLSYRDVEELLAERGLDVSYETAQRWVLKFGPQFARHLRAQRPRLSGKWHLDEMVVSIGGNRQWLWRAAPRPAAETFRKALARGGASTYDNALGAAFAMIRLMLRRLQPSR